MTLKQTIDNMLREARSTRLPARRRLAKGLAVAVRVEGRVIDVQLSRADVYPSMLEWKTVIQQWPGQATVVKPPKAIIRNNEYYLKGQIRVVEELV